MKKLKGIVCVMCTPYKADESVDYDALRFNIGELLKRKNLGGIMINGGTGEFASLTEDERYKCAEVTAKEIDGRVPFVVGVTSESSMQAIKYAQHAESIGADAVMMAPPPYCKPDWEMTLSHYKRVCASVKIPFMVYNNPGTTGVDINLEQSVQLLSEIGNAVYYKESSGSLIRARNLKLEGPPKTVVLSGWEDLALEHAMAGCEGWVCVMANFAPDICIELFEHTGNREWEKAFETYSRMLPALSMIESAGARMVQYTKYAMDLVGFIGAYNRGPRLELSQPEKDIIEAEVRKLGLCK